VRQALKSSRKKRRMTIGEVLILIAVLAVDFAAFRTPLHVLGGVPIAAAFIGLFVILVVSVWFYVPRKHEKLCFRLIYLVYFSIICLAIFNMRLLI
jgi:hypothetical protein